MSAPSPTSFGYDRVAVWGMSGGGPHALACAALLPDLVCAVASLAAIAPYGPADLDYFGGMGQENVDDIKLQLSDPEAAKRKVVLDRDGVLSMTEDQVGGYAADDEQGFESLVSPEDAAAMGAGLGTMVAAFDAARPPVPATQGWWDDGVAHFGRLGVRTRRPSACRCSCGTGATTSSSRSSTASGWPRTSRGVDAHLTDDDGHMTLFFRLRSIHAWLLSQF